MAIKLSRSHQTERGFALLLTLLVVSVLIAIGLTVLDLSIKQVRLSTNAKESESAFHAANAGVECGRYWRRIASSTMEAGGFIFPTCFSVIATDSRLAIIDPTDINGDGNAYLYKYSLSWGTKPRCTKISTLVLVASPTGAGLTLRNVQNYIQGYPDNTSKACTAGERCTILATRGYNRACSTVSGYGSVEREVLLQF